METTIALILGFLASRLQGNWFKNMNVSETWRIRIRYILSFVICVVCGVAVNYGTFLVDGQFSWESLLGNIGVAFAASQTYYNTYFRLKNR